MRKAKLLLSSNFRRLTIHMPRQSYRLSDFDYALPPDLIAQTPAAQRTASRLLHVDGRVLADLDFADLPSLLAPGDLVVFNDTKVIKARLHGVKASGGRIEALIERVLGPREALAQVRASHMPKTGSVVRFADAVEAEVITREDRWATLRFAADDDVYALLDHYGELPLPPYITHSADAQDEERYQTVYARHPGAVAAPTAGLHFDPALLDLLRAMDVELAYLTLHVGAGTFQPVQIENLAAHHMHAEWFTIPQATADAVARTRARGGRVVAVGTTSLRALESATGDDGKVRAGPAETALFITPGYRIRTVDRLLTNFHLPKSTLLMLVSAFGGYEEMRAAYAHAVTHRYRFFSYGDAMLIEPAVTL
jgi:S-adenosylmethionine:tRNA ribosyltransferase-isomerase